MPTTERGKQQVAQFLKAIFQYMDSNHLITEKNTTTGEIMSRLWEYGSTGDTYCKKLFSYFRLTSDRHQYFQKYTSFNNKDQLIVYPNAEVSINNSFDNNNPVYIQSASTMVFGSHAWVIDGIMTTQAIVRIIRYHEESSDTPINNYKTYYRMNWGWEDVSPTWVLKGLFSSPRTDYGNEVLILTNIRRK